MRQPLDRAFLALQLGLGLLWLWLLPLIADGSPRPAPAADPIRWMLLWAGWAPGIALAFWQAGRSRRWRALLLSDLLFSGALVLLSCSVYVPLFFTLIPWFWLYALPPRGVITALLLRLWERLRPALPPRSRSDGRGG